MPKMELEALADALNKATKVVDKCTNENQLVGAVGFIMVLRKRFEYTFERAPLMNHLTIELIDFCIDTRMHFKEGHHRSAKTNWQMCLVHPRIKDYFHKYLEVK